MACLPWVSHHFFSCVSLCGGKIDPSDRSGFSDLYDPVAASLKKWVATAACEIVCRHATEFKWGLQATAVPSAYGDKKLCTMYMLRVGEPPGGKSMGAQVHAWIQSWSCCYRWVICFSNANNIALACRSSWKRAGAMQIFCVTKNNACILTQVIILQVRKTVIGLLPVCDWEWWAF